MKDLKQLFDEVFDYDSNSTYSGDFFRVKKNGKYNFADETGKVAFEDWFDQADDITYSDGGIFSIVERNGLYNAVIFEFADPPHLLAKLWFVVPPKIGRR